MIAESRTPELCALLPSLNHPLVRDLAWACFSANLIANPADYVTQSSKVKQNSALLPAWEKIRNVALPLTAERAAALLSLDKQPAALEEDIGQLQNPLLGIYFERLWRHFLSHDSQVQLLSSHQQIYSPARSHSHSGTAAGQITDHGSTHSNKAAGTTQTVGEIDHLYFDTQRHCHVHLELCVKYYLALDPQSGRRFLQQAARQQTRFKAPSQALYPLIPPDWNYHLGPEGRDRMDLKLGQLFHQQLALTQRAETREQLQLKAELPIARECRIAGRLFYPWQAPFASHASGMHPAAATGLWLSLSQFRSFDTRDRFLALSKRQWLAPAFSASAVATASLMDHRSCHDFLTDSLATDARPVQLAVITTARNEESVRIFVTPDDWPWCTLD